MIEYIEVRDANTYEILGAVDTALSIIWRSTYYGTGDFEIYLPCTWQSLELLQVGNYVTRTDKKEAGIIERLEITFTQEEGRMIVASGRMLKSILDRRVIFNKGSSAFKNYYPSTLKGNVETAVRGLITEQLTKNAYRNLPVTFADHSGSTKTILTEEGSAGERQVSYENLLEYSDAILQEYEMSAYIGISDDLKMVYAIREGIDRSMDNSQGNEPVIFSQDYDSLITSEYVIDESTQKNVCYVAGEGEGKNRFISVYPSSTAISGMDRREAFLDASSITQTYTDENDEERTLSDNEYSDILKGEGKNALTEYPYIETFNGTLDITNGTFKVGEHFNLGDIVTIQDNDLGIYMNRRILVMTEYQDESGYTIECEYGL